MATGSGLCSQFGFKNETTVGTPVTVDHFLKHTQVGGDGLHMINLTDEGLGGCALVPTYDRTVNVARQVTRDVSLNAGTRNLGLLLKQMLGSSAAPAVISGSFYRAIHWNGDLAGKSLTVQFGFPETTAAGTNRAFTVKGAKITSWELAQARNELLKLNFTLDGWDESTATALATASYPAAGATGNEPLRFSSFAAKIGGTPSVTTGLVSVAAGTAISGCRGVSVKGTQPLRTDGWFAGGAGIKSEQILAGNAFQVFTADLDVEFQDRTQLYDVYAAYGTVALELTWTGLIDTTGSSQFGKLSVIMPYTKLDPSMIAVNGPQALDNKTTIKAFGDPAGTLPAIQIFTESLDSTL